jgi:hypothetical protein
VHTKFIIDIIIVPSILPEPIARRLDGPGLLRLGELDLFPSRPNIKQVENVSYSVRLAQSSTKRNRKAVEISRNKVKRKEEGRKGERNEANLQQRTRTHRPHPNSAEGPW